MCADESCWTPTDALDIVAKHAADYISIYVTKAGGLYPARTVAKIAECAGIRCNVNGSGEFGVGTAANLHMACCGANIDLASVFPITHVEGCPEQTKVAARWYMDDIITKPFQYDDGCLLVPDGPGKAQKIQRNQINSRIRKAPDFPKRKSGAFAQIKIVLRCSLKRLPQRSGVCLTASAIFSVQLPSAGSRSRRPRCAGAVRRARRASG